MLLPATTHSGRTGAQLGYVPERSSDSFGLYLNREFKSSPIDEPSILEGCGARIDCALQAEGNGTADIRDREVGDLRIVRHENLLAAVRNARRESRQAILGTIEPSRIIRMNDIAGSARRRYPHDDVPLGSFAQLALAS